MELKPLAVIFIYFFTFPYFSHYEARHKSEKAAMLKLAGRMKKLGETLEAIMKEMGLSEGEIEGVQ